MLKYQEAHRTLKPAPDTSFHVEFLAGKMGREKDPQQIGALHWRERCIYILFYISILAKITYLRDGMGVEDLSYLWES